MAGTRVKTPVGELKYVFIKGEGRNQAMKGEPPRMQYVASFICPKDSDAHKEILAQIDAEWQAYKKTSGAKGKPTTNGIKEEFIKDPSGRIDPDTEEVAKIPTGNVIVTFKTNTSFKEGQQTVVKVKDRKGADITEAYQEAEWAIGEGSVGRIFGTAVGNDIGGKPKVTLYLNGIQLAKLVKFMGSDFEADEIEGDFDAESGDLGDDLTPEL